MKYLKVFTDFLEVTEGLGDAGMGRLFRAMLRYAQDGTEPRLRGKEAVAWAVARQSIDRETAAYETKAEANRQAGRKGAAARWQKGERHVSDGENSQDKDNDKEKDKEKYKDKDSLSVGGAEAPGKREKRPSLEEIEAL